MSYARVLTGLQERLRTISGLKKVLLYEPAALDDPPLCYLFLDTAEITHQGQSITAVYTVTARVVVLWQDNEEAEAQIAPFVDSIVDAVWADPMLGGKANSARVTNVSGGFIDATGVTYRSMDFTITVKEVRT